jgi:23S rRNA pseudouridine2457 synthase
MSFQFNRSSKYIAFNKPYAVLSQFSQPPDSDKVTLARFAFPPHVYPIGRLDYDSEGLLLLSDDPRLNEMLLSPRFGHRRTYLVQVENIPQPSQLEKIKRGVLIEKKLTAPAQIHLLPDEPDIPARSQPIRFRKTIPTAWLSLTISEGRNRQVRNMTAAIGCPTLRLVRVSIGSLNLENLRLKPGEWKYIQDKELGLAFKNS